MQTFLPYSNFSASAKCLDYKRLGKQRVEARQIIKNLTESPDRWFNHPAVQLWKNYEEALKLYYNTIVKEWKKRGYKNNMKLLKVNYNKFVFPHWLGDPDFHDSHKSNLLRKDPEFYGKYNWDVSDNLPYVWKV